MGGGLVLELLTKPWAYGNIIPEPYIMIFALGTFVCAREHWFWGLAASLSWYAGAKVWIFVYRAEDWWVLFPPPEILRLLAQIVFPLAVSARAARSRLREQQRIEVLRVLSAVVPHEFNNQLTVIMGNLSLSKFCDDRHVQSALGSAEHLGELVKSIRHYGKMGLISPELIDISKFLEEVSRGEK